MVIENMRHKGARFIPTLPAVSLYLLENLRSGDVVLVLSAGDADQVSTDVMKGLRKRENNHD
jgi:UDP-N-acetylmuramate--alanine ligase